MNKLFWSGKTLTHDQRIVGKIMEGSEETSMADGVYGKLKANPDKSPNWAKMTMPRSSTQ